MDTKPSAPFDADEQPFKLPSRTYTSTVLNGIGNGMMLGTAPFLGIETYAGIMGKNLPHQKLLMTGSAVAMVAGAVIGGFYGSKEAKQIHDYRQALDDEITDLRQRVNRNNQQIRGWGERVQDEKESTTPQHGRG